MTDLDRSELVLGIYPATRGFGWALFKKPDIPVNWGIAHAGREKNGASLARLGQIIGQFQPDVLVLEQFEGRPSRRTPRIQELSAKILEMAEHLAITAEIYSREAVHSALQVEGPNTRYSVACAVAARVKGLGHRLPPKRKAWMSEDPRISLFNAVALALTYLASSGRR